MTFANTATPQSGINRTAPTVGAGTGLVKTLAAIHSSKSSATRGERFYTAGRGIPKGAVTERSRGAPPFEESSGVWGCGHRAFILSEAEVKSRCAPF